MVLALPPTSSHPDLSTGFAILHLNAIHDYFHANFELLLKTLGRVDGRLLSVNDLFLRRNHENGRDERGKNRLRGGALSILWVRGNFRCTFG